jgi:hypothetical protein
MSREEIEQFVKKFIASHEPDTFIPDKNGNYMYYSECRRSGIRLDNLFHELLEDFVSSPEIPDNLKQVADEMAKELETFYVTNPEWCEPLTKYKQLNTSAE